MIQSGLGSENRNISRAVMATANPAMPTASIRAAMSRARRGPRAGVVEIHRRVAARATRATGTLTKKTARQPSAPTSTPPRGSPSEAVAIPAICRPPSTPPGGVPRPGRTPADQQHRRRIGARGAQADQHPADQQREEVLGEAADDAADDDEGDAGQEHPARTEHLGGLARGGLRDRAGQIQSRDQRGGLPDRYAQPAAIGTRAVAIRELLIGLSAEPMNSGVVNRHEKAFLSGLAPSPAGRV